MSERKDSSNIPALVLKPRYPNEIELFDAKEAFPDVDFCPPGRKALALHRVFLARSSECLSCLLNCKASAFGHYNEDARRIEWPMKETETQNETEKNRFLDVLIRWLRFCYGEEQTFAYNEFCAAISALFRLRLTCQEELLIPIREYVEDISKNHVDASVEMLKLCLEYDECHGGVDVSTGERLFIGDDTVDVSIAKHLFIRDNITLKYDQVVENCLMMLPWKYLDYVEYGDVHTERSAFNIRAQYIKEYPLKTGNNLSLEDKRAIMEDSRVSGKDLNSTEIKKLFDLGIFDPKELFERCRSALIVSERRVEEAERVCARYEFLVKLMNSPHETTKIETIHKQTNNGGAIYHKRRNIIVHVSYEANQNKDVFVTYLDTGKTECLKNTSFDPPPFDSYVHAPVYDQKDCIYFMENSHTGKGQQFGRLNLAGDSFKFELLQSLSGKKFAEFFGGCFHHNTVYAVDNNHELCAYDVAGNTWSSCGITVPNKDNGSRHVTSVRLMCNPNDDKGQLYCMASRDSTLYRIDVEAHTITPITKAPGDYTWVHDCILLSIDKDVFVIIVALNGAGWYCYNSDTGTWNKLDRWGPFSSPWGEQNYLVYVESEHAFYFHLWEKSTWEKVKMIQKQ